MHIFQNYLLLLNRVILINGVSESNIHCGNRFKIKAMNTKKLFQLAIAFMVFILIQEVSIGQAISTKHEKINFTSFTVNTHQKRIMIDWATDNKVPTNYFEIERSSDGVNFKTIALVLGPDPKQTSCDCYECFDKPGSNAKKYFYRLKHISIDGEIDLSEMKMLAIK
jgi:hypothetical protein